MKPLEAGDPRYIGGYRVLRVLGAGGMGRVYLGRNRGGRVVAIKVVRAEWADDPGFRERFRREVDAARRVGGAWTAPVLDADTEAATPWVVTGYVAGPSVYEAVAGRGPLPEETVRTLGAGLAEALTAIHAAGLVHRDIKPSNVLLSLDGPRVIDFGISRAMEASVLTRTGHTVGSPGFMSPEQVDGRDIGPPSDVFSLGSVLVFAATGSGPFGEGSGQALMYRIVAQEPRLEELPVALREIVAACMTKHASSRPTPAEVLAALSPGGTADLVAGHWLPMDLTTALSRRAVELLELDDDGTPDASGTFVPTGTGSPTWDDRSGATGYPSTEHPSAEPPSAERSGGQQHFGAQNSGPQHFGPQQSGSRQSGSRQSGPQQVGPQYFNQQPPGPQPSGPQYPDPHQHPTSGPPRPLFSPPGSATPPAETYVPPPRPEPARPLWRRPWVYPVVAVVIGGAVAAALLLPDDSDGKEKNRGRSADTASSGGPSRSGSNESLAPSPSGTALTTGKPDTAAGTLPRSFYGTWSGPVVSTYGTKATVTITLTGGNVGAKVGTSKLLGNGALGEHAECEADQELVAVTGSTEVKITSHLTRNDGTGCVDGEAILKPGPNNTMAYNAPGTGILSSASTGTLTRQGD
ncbi:serine/threonine-protein kinase [Streptomyces sp. SID3343]|uniref:protein kinase domain-containing protein n=1 Tax=Streptomyces sp. SID3343 TaxID=2690260 RepID=UPI001370E5B0|nr:protein kinase [Streptomyces sp. SID3343]